MADRYPAVEPSESGLLQVTNGHQVYWETVGERAGLPAVYLHGGPGSGCRPEPRRYFDPAAYRAVLFDQRGCGRSRPLADDPQADLSANTTAHLIDDVERLREQLGIDRWVVVGTSWGVSLGLAYAQRHPERVIAMVLAAVTGGTRHEVDWITRDMGRVFPREWERFLAASGQSDRNRLPAAYARLLADPDPLIHGRYDVSGPLDTAWHLHHAWPGSRLVVLEDAGHGGGDFPGEIVGALDSYRDLH